MTIRGFFSRWFYIAIILVLIGLIFASIESSHKEHQYFFDLISKLSESVGIAILVANIFSFTIGTTEFLQYIRQRLIDIVVSKDFIARLNQEEQRELLKMTLKPPRKLSEIYSGIDDYFKNYIDNSLALFDTCYRGHIVLSAEASMDQENHRLRVDLQLDYIVYRVAERFDPLLLWFEGEDSVHVETKIKSPRGEHEILTEQKLTELHDIRDPSMKQGYEMEVPDRFNQYRHINISRKIIEYGNDHWQIFSYKTIKPCDQLLLNLRCKDGIVVRRCDTYGLQDDFEIETSEDKTHIRVAYNDWLSPGFGVNILLADDTWHNQNGGA